MGWLRVGGSLNLYVTFAKEPYKKDDILQKRPIILRSLLIVATPYLISSLNDCIWLCVCVFRYCSQCWYWMFLFDVFLFWGREILSLQWKFHRSSWTSRALKRLSTHRHLRVSRVHVYTHTCQQSNQHEYVLLSTYVEQMYKYAYNRTKFHTYIYICVHMRILKYRYTSRTFHAYSYT